VSEFLIKFFLSEFEMSVRKRTKTQAKTQFRKATKSLKEIINEQNARDDGNDGWKE
jgi:uncharacterized protein with von Willebrand factor type A (vWA) domain